MSLKRKTARNILLTLAFVFLPQFASAQTNTFPPSGNVGVGTTTPVTDVEVKNSSHATVTVNSGAGSTDASILFQRAGVNQWFLQSRNSGTPADSFAIYDAVNTTFRFVVNRSGNVGIGTTNPLSQLHFGTLLNAGLKTYTASDTNHGFLFSSYMDTNSPYRRYGDIVAMSNQDGISGGSTIRFLTNPNNSFTALERMRIDYLGNIGIGTTSPSTKFHISAGDSSFALFGPNVQWGGSLVVGSGNSFLTPISGRAQVLTSNGNLHLDGGTNQSVYIGWLTPTNTIINGQGGTVGINMQYPNSAYKLDVNGEINATGIRINGTPISGGGGSQWSGSSPITYTAGNVGIGTTTPGGRLHVYGPSGNDLFVGAYGNTLNFLYDSSGDDVSGWVNFVGYQGGTTKFRDFSIGNGKNTAIAFFDGSSGNVGIGTNNPSQKLEVYNATGPTYFKATSGSAGTYLGTDGTNSYIQAVSPNQKIFLSKSDGSAVLTADTGSGNVGIGKTDPQYKLDVVGDIKASGTIHAKYQDLAEWVPSSEQLAAGTVVVLDTTKSNQVVSATVAYDTRVAGVISAQPGITLGESGEDKVLVATTGRVRVKVDASRAPIQIGDLLVTSDVPGVAMKSEAVNLGGVHIHRPGTIIGKALEPLAKGSGEILVLLSLQ